jgi:hypothetical protein
MNSRLIAAATSAVAGSLLWASAAGATTVTLEAGTGPAGSVTQLGSSSTNGSLVANASGPHSTNVFQVDASGINLPQLLNASVVGTGLTVETLNIWVTETGLSAPLGSIQFPSSFGLDPANTSGNVTVVESIFLSAANTLFGTDTALGSATCTQSGCVPLTGSATASTGAGPYSVTEEFSITSPTAGDKVDATINLDPTAAPIP